jgi:hypothetical protein
MLLLFFYIFGQSSNSLTHRKARIAFICGQKEYARCLSPGRRLPRPAPAAAAVGMAAWA